MTCQAIVYTIILVLTIRFQFAILMKVPMKYADTQSALSYMQLIQQTMLESDLLCTWFIGILLAQILTSDEGNTMIVHGRLHVQQLTHASYYIIHTCSMFSFVLVYLRFVDIQQDIVSGQIAQDVIGNFESALKYILVSLLTSQRPKLDRKKERIEVEDKGRSSCLEGFGHAFMDLRF